MAEIVLFLSETTLKERSVVQQNVDMKVVTPSILDVQERYILPIMGTALYNLVVDQIRNSNLSAANRTLLDDYITRTMIWYCRMELPMDMNYKYFNKSVGVQGSDNTTPASIEELQYIQNRAKNNAEWYATRMTKYLLSNPDLYPLYLNQPDANIDTIFANMTNYTSGMVLGGDGCCKGRYNFQNIPIQPAEIRVQCSICD